MKLRQLQKTTRVGDRWNVKLKMPATSGYTWNIPIDRNWRILKKSQVAGTSFGGASTEVYTIEMLKPGKTTIAADLKRPWESEPIERLEIMVDVLP